MATINYGNGGIKMSVGNITPRTATQTLAGMLLGAETYPSSIQQALCNNTGWLMYKPLHLYQNVGTAVSSSSGTAHSSLVYSYFNAGQYDLQIRMAATNAGGAGNKFWLELDGSLVSALHVMAAGVGTTTIETFAGATIATAGWYLFEAYVYAGVALSTVTSVDICARQYT